MTSEWTELRARLRRRVIRTVDVLSILVLDAVMLLAGNGLILGVEHFTTGKNAFFEVAKNISHGVFVLLYVAWVAWDLWEFWKKQ